MVKLLCFIALGLLFFFSIFMKAPLSAAPYDPAIEAKNRQIAADLVKQDLSTVFAKNKFNLDIGWVNIDRREEIASVRLTQEIYSSTFQKKFLIQTSPAPYKVDFKRKTILARPSAESLNAFVKRVQSQTETATRLAFASLSNLSRYQHWKKEGQQYEMAADLEGSTWRFHFDLPLITDQAISIDVDMEKQKVISVHLSQA